MAPFSTLPVREVIPAAAPPDRWPFTLPAVRRIMTHGLELDSLTILVGENGSGKSTLLEGIALAYGLSPEGGSTNARLSTRASESDLCDYIRLVRGAGVSKYGYFIRAETMFGLFTYLEENPGLRPEPRYHELSHGQAFTSLVTEKTMGLARRGGLLVLDEPEAGLSFVSQLALVLRLERLVAAGVQVLIATHSPIVAAAEGARLLQLDDDGMQPVEWSQLSAVALYRRFLADPGSFVAPS